MYRTLIVAGLVACALTACGSSSKTTPGGSGSARTFNLQITKDGCAPAVVNTTPGPANFVVTNVNADDITELEVKSGNSIVGEAENLTPGLTGKFSFTLKPGEYETSCPDGKSGKIVVSGTTASTTASTTGAIAAVTTYRDYVERQTALLVNSTEAFTDAVKAGDVAKAKAEFANARAPYERIEPIAESFGDLDPAIDAREGDVPAAEWGGFHRIEKQLWTGGNTDGMGPVADKLLADVKQLRAKIPSVQLEPAQIANGAVELLNEVATSKVTGQEDRYSHTDLSDFAANVDGAKAAADSLDSLVGAKDGQLAPTIDARFDTVNDLLARYRKGDGYVAYTTLTQADTKALATAVDALADEIAKTPPLVVSS